RTLTVISCFRPQDFSSWMARPEKPHCGNCAVPFMNNTTGFSVTVWLRNSCTVVMATSMQRRYGWIIEGARYALDTRQIAMAVRALQPCFGKQVAHRLGLVVTMLEP